MVRVFVAFLLFLFTCTMPLHAQQEWDYGVHIGYSNYLGDIGGSGEPSGGLGDMQFSQNSLALGVFARKRLNHFAIKFNLNCLRIKGEDNLSMDPKRFGRNLSFRNDIIELGARVEYNFITLMDLSGRRDYRWNFDAYIFTGFSMFYHNPKGNLNGTWHSLQPLHTEGPGQAYKRLQPSIPIGIGFYFTHKQRGSIRIGKPKGLFRRTKKRRTSDVKRVHRFGLEFNLRITFTDYLDDISTFYPNPDALESDLARSLSNRSNEVANDPEFPSRSFYLPGAIRGNPGNDDSYLSFTFVYSRVRNVAARPGQSQHARTRKSWWFYRYGRKKVRY